MSIAKRNYPKQKFEKLQSKVLQNNWHVGQKQINNPEQQFEEQLSRMANCKTCKTMHKTPICVYCNKLIESNILQIIVTLPLCRAIS